MVIRRQAARTGRCWLFAICMAIGFTVRGWSDTSTSSPRPSDDPHFGETKGQRDTRMAWWREARFGMFIHWGLYAVPAGFYHGAPEKPSHGEWIMHDCKIPVAEYAGYAGQFNPTQFDAEKWVQLAQDAGMKYIVITAKHHEGFAMFPSQVGGFNIVDNTPFKRDPLRELADACRKHGIKLGFYYSQNQDWHQPGGSAGGGHWDPAQDGSLENYIKTIAVPQVKELLTNYGPGIPAVLWWDTPMDDVNPKLASLFQPIVALRPDLITNNRLSSAAPPGQGYPGDTESPEQHIPPQGYPGRDWETCMTINDTWGFKSNDTRFKSTEVLLRNLIDIASKGGNYLLNVGPDATGVIPGPEAERLQAMGQWLRVNGEAIYGTESTPFKRDLAWGRVTHKENRFYLHVLDWPVDRKLLLPLKNKADRAFLLTAPNKPLSVSSTEAGVSVTLPPDAPDPIASVVVVDIIGAADPVPLPPIALGSDGILSLNVVDADILNSDGSEPIAKLQGGPSADHPDEKPNLGTWINAKDYVQWNVSITKPGKIDIFADYAAAPNVNGIGFILSIGGQTLDCSMDATGDWKSFRKVKVGTLNLNQLGTVTLRLNRDQEKGTLNLRSISFVPQ